MTRYDEEDEVIDLKAMLGEAEPPAQAPVGNPLTTLASDVYLLNMRDAAVGPQARERDSFAAVASQTLPPAAPKRSHLPAVIGFAVGATLVGGLAAWLSMRVPTTAATAVRSQEARPGAMLVTPADTAAAKAAPARLAEPERRAAKRASSAKHASRAAVKPSPAPVAAPAPVPNEEEPVAEPTIETSEPTVAVEQPPTPFAPAKAEEEAAPPAIAPPTIEERREAPVEAKGRGPMTGPARPSLGSLAAALRAVLPAARSCLQPGATAKTGQLTFGSDGTVSSVQLSGAATSDDCIRSALSNAKVPPFNENSFKTPFVVRP